MSEHTTGVAQANARVSTMPKLSRPIEGATRTLAAKSSSVSLSSETLPRTSIAPPESPLRRMRKLTESGSAPITRRRDPVRAVTRGQARRRCSSPLRGSCRPTKTTVPPRFPGAGRGGSGLLRGGGDPVVDALLQNPPPQDVRGQDPATAGSVARRHDGTGGGRERERGDQRSHRLPGGGDGGGPPPPE